ncbi:FAD-binding oxidoreductase [Roseitranquillus sediminis]|uniref:FAD-binding oxidoreductase n=1 Tax=Roseitranquillus sediminis TaxID=2809051 RepID=UPI001D0CBCA2|nr:FAD-linked oxidase C-terminal domain-containing protein [Roseitranquillus sediminis]MBM9594615.1 FAD-binding protein [Roseitranquillus sediminis]
MTLPAALTELASFLGDRLSRSKSDLAIHGRSEAHFAETAPDAVAYPETTEEVSRLVQVCAANGVPVVGWGAGTSLEGHALAVRGGVVVDFGRMARLLSVDADDMLCTVEPGVTRRRLNEELRATGLFFPVDPGADASLGGMASTRASGTTAVRYGTMRDNVLGLTVVLADGRVIRTGSRARNSAAGYDLTALFVGAEGTLGLITELTLRLRGQPEAVTAGVCAFPDTASAVAAVIATIQSGVPMARIEYLDAASAAAFNAYAGADFPELPHLMVEFHGSEAGAAEDAARFGEIADEFGCLGFRWSAEAEARNRLWRMRHDAYHAIIATRPGARPLVTDICVPISRLAEAIEETAAEIAASPIAGPILGHVGDGNFHATLLIDPEAPGELEAARTLAARMNERALRLGGTVTGEHGIGMGKMRYMEGEHGAAWAVMAELKRALDPAGIMNPGKVVEAD